MKDDENLLCAFANINGLSRKVKLPKERMLRKIITDYDIDIMGISEVNINWNKVEQAERWEERTSEWWENFKSITAHNTEDEATRAVQQGGCLQVAQNKASNCFTDSGRDPTGLGRWVWTRHCGKNGISLCVISAYRPCAPHSRLGQGTIHRQHLRYLHSHQDDRAPREALLEDLSLDISKFQNQGDQIILMGDFNQHVCSDQISEFAHYLNLREAITQKHSEIQGFVPTWHRGRDPIDGIFISPTLHITAGGYLPFGESPGDHRLLWISVSYDLALGYNMHKPVPIKARRLNLQNPKHKKKFQADYKEYIRREGLDTMAFELQEELITRPFDKTMQSRYELLYNKRKEGMLQAERTCRKLKMGEVAWSRTLQSSMDTIQLWRTVLSRKNGTRVSTRFISRLERRVSISDSLRNSKATVKTYLDKAYKHYFELKKDADNLRESWLRDLAAIKANEDGGDQETIYHNLLERERQRRASRRLRRVMGKINSGGLNKVIAPNTDGTETELTSKTDIEEACNDSNRKKFQQTSNTPPMSGDLVHDLGYTGNSIACQDILNGTYEPPDDVDEYTKEYLRHLKKPLNIVNPPEAIITTDDYQQVWKKSKERTSAGISGIHFGHMKACAEDDTLAAFEATMCHIPYTTGYSPSGWKKSVSVMLLKKGKGHHVDDLRTIQLMEAEFNANNKKIGRDVMRCAELNEEIPKEQYGSRKGKRAILHAVNKRLLYDIIHMQRRPAALCSNDAKSCYDRIVHSIASMALQRLGMPSGPVTCMLVTIQNFNHHVRTTFGNSETALFNIDGQPFQGICQGNGAGPTIWVAVSAPLLDMMRAAGHGVHYTTPLSNSKDSLVGFAFVDDTDIVEGQLNSTPLTFDEVMHCMQRAVDRWEGGLQATGGAIRPEKSFIYPIEFKFSPSGQYSFTKVEDMDHTITVKDEHHQRQELQMIDSHVGKETLGVYLAPDGNCEDAKRVLIKKAMEWKSHIVTGHIPAREAWQCVSSTITKTLEYPLPALSLSRKDCQQIMKPVKDAGLSQASVCHTFPLDLVYGSTDLMGLGMTDLYVSQGLAHVEIVQEYIRSTCMIGSLLRTAIEWAKIHVGSDQNFFDLDFDKYGHLLPQSFLKTTWQFVHEYNIKMPTVLSQLQPSRDHDKFLMDTFVNAEPKFTATELQRLNRCRLYLHVSTVSDITDGSGVRISKQSSNGHRDPDRPQYHDWPEQGRPGPREWQLWRKALKICFASTTLRELDQPLGVWIDGHRQHWKWFYNPQARRLYFRHGRRWKVYKLNSHQTRDVQKGTLFKYDTNAISLPPNSQRATVIHFNNKVRIQGWSHEGPTFQPNTDDPLAYTWMVRQTYQPKEHINHLVRALRENKKVIAVSDGSFHPDLQHGTAAWVIRTEDDNRIITGNNLVPGDRAAHCSHRSELSGLIGTIHHLNTICTQHNITQGSVELGCDGEDAYRTATRYMYTSSSKHSHHDLTSKLHTLIKESPITWTFRHVKGHQDKIKELDTLDIWEQMNVKADELAKAFLWETIENGEFLLHIPDLPNSMPTLSVTVNNERKDVHSKTVRTLKNIIATARSTRYWVKHGRPIHDVRVDMEALQHATKNTPTWNKRWLSKWQSGICGVGKHLQRWREQNHSRCPRCQTENETVMHVMQCQHEDAVNLWTTGVVGIEKWMSKNHSLPGLAAIIGRRLRAWQRGNPLPQEDIYDPQIYQIIQEMDSLGWDNIIFGTLPKCWSTYQQRYLRSLGHKLLGTNWISRFIRKLWDLQKAMWTHRNTFVHKDSGSVHDRELKAIDESIKSEFTRGLDGLPREFSGSFTGELKKKLEDWDVVYKQQWLASIWYARDNLRLSQGLDEEVRDPLAQAFITRFHLRRKRKRNLMRFL